MDTTEKLFSEFEPVTKEQWKTKASEDLKGADFDKKLVWKTDDGFPVQPFYTAEDLQGNSLVTAQNHFAVKSNLEWINYSLVPVLDAEQGNRMAVEMVKFGARGILFQFHQNESFNLNVLLNNLDVEKLQISFTSSRPSTALVTAYFEYLKQKEIDPATIRGFYECDILEQWITGGNDPDFDALAEVIKMTLAAPGFKALVIKSHAFINAGSNTIQELAFTLNQFTDYIDKLSGKGITAADAIENLLFHLAIGGDYFFEIAKIRALRTLSKSILNLYGVDVPIEILSSNSTWSKTYYDANVNMLRNTTEAMSAIIGGCDGLLTYPHDFTFAAPSNFSQRIALNISNLLKEESYFDKVVDPAAGSYYIETLTEQLTESSLALFKQMEAAGGFIHAFSTGLIQEQIGQVKKKKEKDIAFRKRVYVGTNKYPNTKEKEPLKEINSPSPNKAGIPLLHPQHAARSFELLKDRTIRNFERTGFLPKVLLACFGQLASRKARASFASEFFVTAGFEILGEFFFEQPVKAAEESAKSSADIVVICSSDAEYELNGVAFAEQFRSISKDKVLVLAGYPEQIVPELKSAGVDTFIHIKSDAIDVLTEFQNKLF